MEKTMTNEPTLLFLHGVGKGDHEGKWRTALASSLAQLGYPSFDSRRVVAPKYAHMLTGWDDTIPLPQVTIKTLSRELARTNRREFERRIGAVEFRMGRHDHGVGGALNDAVVGAAMMFPQFDQARKYLGNKEIRANVLTKILHSLPDLGDIVIVGHSLGSVVAADLLRRLPPGLKCVGMVTIGSPLANCRFDVDLLRDALKEPPTNLSWWVNFWNPLDPVAASRGLSSVFPWLLDIRVTTNTDLHVHDAENYFKQEAVAAAIGYALFGSLSKEVERASSALDTQLDDIERMTLTALRYASHIRMQLEGDLHAKYTGALRHVQGQAIEGLQQRNDAVRRSIPSAVRALAFDVADPDAVAPQPLPVGYISKEEAVVIFTVLASENFIRPFEIKIDKTKRQKAMEELSAEMGLGSRFGTDVFAAAEAAHNELSGGVKINWLRLGLLGAGAAAVVAATGGLALAAAPGLAGAAVVTSALATFGPGGMIGGLITAGTLVTAGGSSFALGLTSSDTKAEVLESVVERQLASAILRSKQRLDPDDSIWWNLVEMEAQLRREYERVDEFSDGDAQSIKELKSKLTIVERALSYLGRNGLGYDPFTTIADE